MGFLVKKPKGIIFSGIIKLAIISLIVNFGSSFIDTIWAVYLNSFVNSTAFVGLFSSFLSLISLFSFFLIIPLIEKSGKSNIFSFSLFFLFLSYLMFAINRNFYIFALIAILITILFSIRITSFGIIVRDKSSEKKLSRNEGVMYTFGNLAWLLSPLVAGFVSDKYGINIIFVLSAFFTLIALLLFKTFRIKDKNIKKRADKNILRNFKDFFRNKNRTLAYILGGGVNFWWSLIYIFMPIYIIEKGLGMQWVGYFLFAVSIPLILFSYPFSKLAGKIGFKKIFKTGFFILFVLATISFFIEDIYLLLFVLILASTGMAMLEAPTEAYFFDVLKGKEELRFYGPYNTTIDVHHFISRSLSALLLLFLPFKFIFLFFGFSMLIFFFLSSKIKNVIEMKRGKKRKPFA